MKNLYGVTITQLPHQPLSCGTSAGIGSDLFEVNVIFTDQGATAAALKFAQSFARDLGACIRLRAAIVVPMRLHLDQPPVSVPFMVQVLRDLVGQPEPNGSELSAHLYVCRDWIETLLEVLKPDSLVVIGGRKHWWPTAASRMAGTLRARGHRVAVVDVNGQTTGNLR